MRMATFATIVAITSTVLAMAAPECHAVHCTITTTPVNFGLYDIFSSFPLTSTGRITISCSNPEKKPLPVTVTVSAGSSGSFSQRRMTSSAAGVLLYNLYGDSSMSQVVGDGSSGTMAFTDSISRPFPRNITLYGRIPARQVLPAGVYTDTLTATVIW